MGLHSAWFERVERVWSFDLARGFYDIHGVEAALSEGFHPLCVAHSLGVFLLLPRFGDVHSYRCRVVVSLTVPQSYLVNEVLGGLDICAVQLVRGTMRQIWFG